MKYDKIICWVNAETQQKITKEYLNHEIILVSSFDDFMEKITDNSLNLIGASNFDNFDTSGIVYKVIDFCRSRPNQIFHILQYMDKDKAGLCCGELSREPNIVDHMIHLGYNGTIQTRIDTGL